ncbi:MAG: hypothetical protein ACT4TC_10460, partial [Myxococcaceae bacterium]
MPTSISPASLQNAVAQLEATRSKERDGLLNAPGKLITDIFSKTGKHLDEATREARAALNEGMADGALSADEAQRVQSAVMRGALEATHYENAKERVGNIAGGLLMGLAPLGGAAGIAAVALKAALLNVGTHAVLEGKGYSAKDLAKDAVVGAGTMGVAAKMWGAKSLALTDAASGTALAAQAAIVNGTSNAVFSGLQQGLRDDNWSEGVGSGAAKTAAAAG